MLTRNILFSFLLLLGSVLSSGCTPSACPGKAGCTCDDKNPCQNGYLCTEGTCKPTAEETDNERPTQEAPTEQDAGPTERCDPGSAGCRCLAQESCAAGLRCEKGVCQACQEGSAGCACKGGACDGALVCENNRCLRCEGKAYCACYKNHSCDVGARCDIANDGRKTCKPCAALGEEGCHCEQDSHCAASLLCVNKRCQPPAALAQLPKDPKCYSPCEGNIRDRDGTLRPCHPTLRLIDGCLVGQVCNNGSCVSTARSEKLSATAYPFCMQTSDCPSWQSCIQGRCYSNCKVNAECPEGTGCYAYTCRKRCAIAKAECPNHETCQNVGSTQDEGFCLPSVPREADAPARSKISEVFQISEKELRFSNREPTAEVAIANNSDFEITLQITRESDNTGASKPLAWLSIDTCQTYTNDALPRCQSFSNKPTIQEPFTISLKGKSRIILNILNADKVPQNKSTYVGVLRFKNEALEQRLDLTYRRSTQGRWMGKMYSFGHFEDTHIDQFPAPNNLDLRTLKNAFLRRWLNFKRREITFDQFRAVLEALRTDSWRSSRTQEACKRLFSTQASEDVACYPFSSQKGYEILSDSQREAAVPSGITALDMALDVKEVTGNQWEGRIVSEQTLHYPGDPQIKVQFAETPGNSSMSLLTSLQAVVDLGGRYAVASSGACTNPTTFQKTTFPWFVPGFTLDSSVRSGSLFRERAECRSQTIPQSIPPSATETQRAAILAYNQSLSAANPIPNGRTLRRTLELVDGVLYENQVFFAIIRERFTSPFASSNNTEIAKDWVRYGYVLLQPTESEFKEADAQGSPASRCTDNASCGSNGICQNGVCQGSNTLQQVTCTPAIVRAAINRSINKIEDLRSWSESDMTSLVSALMGKQRDEIANESSLHILRSENNGEIAYTYARDGFQRFIHYFCEETRQFNGGPQNNPQDCPAASKVIYFETTLSEQAMRSHPCQNGLSSANTCDIALEQFRTNSSFRENVPYRCVDTNAVLCSNNRKDLREGKIFFKPSTQTQFVSPLAPLEAALLEAFRYRLKFQSRTGQSLGFAPTICDKSLGGQIPYCYDPAVIEEIEQRVNCLEAIFTEQTLSQTLSSHSRTQIKSFLEKAFSYSNRMVNGVLFTDLGFETLNAELKVMLGDDAFTRSLNSRYDLANSRLISFEGDLLEPNGVRLSGALGNEMYHLYLSIHYYQMVLDRFYAQADTFLQSFRQSSTSFLTAASVSTSMRKLLLAASRKARSWNVIAKKYHQINRSDLAQRVLERAYLAAYLEQIVFTQLLHNLMQTLDSKQIPQLRSDIEQLTLTYSAALLEMQESHQKVLKKLDFFGLPEGYIPFPALTRSAATASPLNAFSTSLITVKEKLATAHEKEQIALQNNRSFETDAANFQSEIVKLEQNYNEQLIQICGELKEGDRSVPAVPKYAHLYRSGEISDPCGLVPGGALYNAYATLERVAQDMPQLEQQRSALYQRIDNEKQRIQKFCNDRFQLADIAWSYQDKQKNLQLSRDTTDLIWQSSMRAMAGLAQISASSRCLSIGGTAVSTECLNAKLSTTARLVTLIAQEAAVAVLSVQMNNARKEMAALQRDFSKVNIQIPCTVCPTDQPDCNQAGVAQISSQNYLAQLTLELEAFRLQMLTARYNASLVLSQIVGLRQRADRLLREQEDSTALLLNVQAAQNDPNIRIYKNDAILTAERTFEEAVQEAYSLTLIYEYYTSSSYAQKNDLYLVRMISSGDKNLESYVSQLEQAYRDFEERYGRPALRVMVLSLRDDILRIPHIAENGEARSLQERVQAFQQHLNDPKNYTPEGYFHTSFSISVDPKTSAVSPVTYGHKIVYLEAEIKATERGDDVGRVYLRQNGTGVIREANDQFQYYALPERTAVINTFFNGHKTFDLSVYQNYRFQDRPLGNTQWQLLFNQASEKANQDIVLHSINDIVLYVYYQDFSKP